MGVVDTLIKESKLFIHRDRDEPWYPVFSHRVAKLISEKIVESAKKEDNGDLPEIVIILELVMQEKDPIPKLVIPFSSNLFFM